jgi:hypothetical protein
MRKGNTNPITANTPQSNEIYDWVHFLFMLGNHVEQLRTQGRKPAVVVVSPTIDFASAIIAGGIICQSLSGETQVSPNGNIDRFRHFIGSTVKFPRVMKGATKQFKGILECIEIVKGVEMLKIRYHASTGKNQLICWSFVGPADFPLVSVEHDRCDISSKPRGRKLATEVGSLERLLGKEHVPSLLGSKMDRCWIIDTKKRLTRELEESIPLYRFTHKNLVGDLTLKDLVRPDLPFWPAVADTSHSHIDTIPPKDPSWSATIAAGNLPFLRHFQSLCTPIRVAVISPVMSCWAEAIVEAQRLFRQRSSAEVVVPNRLLFAKPASLDLQIWEDA